MWSMKIEKDGREGGGGEEGEKNWTKIKNSKKKWNHNGLRIIK